MVNHKSGQIQQGILIYTTGDFPYGMAPESLVRQMALGLKFHNIRLKVIRLRGKWYNYKNDTGIDASNFVLPHLPKTEIFKIFELFTYLFFIPFSVIKNKLSHKTDAVILYGVEYFYEIFPYWIACKITKTKLIRITTDLYRESTIVPVWWKRPKLFFYLFQFKHFDKYLDGIVSLSNYMADFAKKNGVKLEKIVVIPHFIDIEGFCKGIVLTQTQGRIKLGFCGTVNEPNGIYDLIAAFKIVHSMHPETELLIVGEPSQYDKIKIIKMIATVADAVKITGLLSQDKVPQTLMTCQILINPRASGLFAEAGFPTKLGEYFATKKPVVATKVGDIISYFSDRKELVLAEPDHPQSLASAILFLINNKAEADQIGINGFIWAKNHLDYINNSKKLIEFINTH